MLHEACIYRGGVQQECALLSEACMDMGRMKHVFLYLGHMLLQHRALGLAFHEKSY